MSTDATYLLHLDKEGFPVSDSGLRIDDSSFLSQVFLNIHRFQDDDKQPLCTLIDGKTVLLSSFDDPLVAQSVELVGDEIRWSFLGGLNFTSALGDLRVDEWDRLHAYLGPHKIPVVMSHKVQSAFLLHASEKLNPDILPFRSATDKLDSERWDLPYQKNTMPWDMGKLNPVIEKHSQKLIEFSGESLLIPGAGSGHEVPFFEKYKKKVTALDFSPTAKSNFKKFYPSSLANYLVSDFFKLDKMTFDAVLELAFFVAIDPKLRPDVVRRIHSLLSPRGYWGGCFITRYASGGPPFGLSEYELQRHIEGFFEIVEWQRSPYSHPRRRYMELWVLLKKR